MDGWREAADVLHGHALRVAGLHVLVEHGEDLVVEDLKLADAVHHLLQGLANRRRGGHNVNTA